uniref:Uncharacterized protein n=1 Tax=Moniliophthora roreri TaxID=221103 RepID=A0A0W0FJ92_MONRR
MPLPQLKISPPARGSENASEGRAERILSLTGDAIQTLLITLNEIACFTSVPYLSDASSLALGTLGAVQQCHSNKANFIALAERACELVIEIDETCKATVGESQGVRPSEFQPSSDQVNEYISPLMKRHLKKLFRTFLQIEHFARGQKDINWFIRFIKHKSDAAQIEDFRRKLDEAMSAFTMQSLIVIREKLERTTPQGVTITPESQSYQTPTTNSMFGPNFSGSISGNTSFNNVARDQHNVHRYGEGTDVFNRSGSEFIQTTRGRGRRTMSSLYH